MKLKKLLVISILLLGGVFMFFSLNNNNNKKEQPNHQEAALLRQEQETIALYLVNKYDNIETLTFDSISDNRKTGYKRIYIYINNDILVAVIFSDYGENDYTMTLYKNYHKLVDKSDNIPNTLEKVSISYYEGDIE